MMRLTIYRVGETVEILSGTLLGKDFPSNVVKEFTITSKGPIGGPEDLFEKIKIRPYYRKKVNGVLNIFAEEELENGN